MKNLEGYSVFDVYGKPSQRKINAEKEILQEMEDNNGYGYHIISHNTFMFTCGYYYKDENGVEHFVYHTPTKRIDKVNQLKELYNKFIESRV